MKIKLDKLETNKKINGLGLKRSVDAQHYAELYFDTDLSCYIAIRHNEGSDSKYSGKIIIERGVVSCAQVAEESVPKHQPIGTPAKNDTPTGGRKKRSVEGGKETIAERIAARAADKASQD